MSQGATTTGIEFAFVRRDSKALSSVSSSPVSTMEIFHLKNWKGSPIYRAALLDFTEIPQTTLDIMSSEDEVKCTLAS